jgi:hypothetical protein
VEEVKKVNEEEKKGGKRDKESPLSSRIFMHL